MRAHRNTSETTCWRRRGATRTCRSSCQGVVDRLGGYPNGMPQVQVFADVHRNAESMWGELGSFQSIAPWHPMVTTAEGEGEEPGATRTLETSDGVRGAERMTQTDQSPRVYLYALTGMVLPIADFLGGFPTRDGRPHRCNVICPGQYTVATDEEK